MPPEESDSLNTRQKLQISDDSTRPIKEIIVLKDTKPGTKRLENSPIPYMTKTINKLKLTRPKKNDYYVRLQ